MNKLTIIGNLTRAPELRTTQTGKNVCSFTVAVNRRRSANGQQEADFFRVTAWDKLGEHCSKYLDKGKKVAVVGPVKVSTYTANDGSTRAQLDLTADEVEFLNSQFYGQTEEEPRPKAESSVPSGFEEVTDEDLPWE